jgi:hypothetical protein
MLKTTKQMCSIYQPIRFVESYQYHASGKHIAAYFDNYKNHKVSQRLL